MHNAQKSYIVNRCSKFPLSAGGRSDILLKARRIFWPRRGGSEELRRPRSRAVPKTERAEKDLNEARHKAPKKK